MRGWVLASVLLGAILGLILVGVMFVHLYQRYPPAGLAYLVIVLALLIRFEYIQRGRHD